MNISWKVLLAPIMGAGFSWLASKGLELTPGQQEAAIGLGATFFTAVGHIIEEWQQKKAAQQTLPPPQVPKL